MNGNALRSYNCKNEELSVICGFSAQNLRRDLSDFTGYSPMFNEAYLTAYEAKIAAVEELVQPKSEIVEQKIITERIYSTLDGLFSPINYVEGYVDLAGKTIPISAADFGLVQLRKSARSHDVESALNLLRTVTGNLKKYKVALTAKGLTEELTDKFSGAATSLADDKNKKYALTSNRAALVQTNVDLLNDLYDQLTEICKIGKILYKTTDKAKLNDYTFSHLLKQVRRVDKPEEDKPAAKDSEGHAAE